MSITTSYPHIDKLDGQPARLARLPRIRVAQVVMDYWAHGWSVEEMCRQQLHLRIAEAHAAMLYYWDNQREIEAEIEAEVEQVARDRANAGPSPSLMKMRARGMR